MSGRERALWIFGYGSLVWRPAFAHAERRPAFVRGFRRRFWQGSSDHRGVPGAPGRVVTLVPGEPHERCWGSVYEVEAGHEQPVLATLDHREQGGYERREITVETDRGPLHEVLVYLATPANPEWLGDAPLEHIAEQIRRSAGPSGSNLEYLLCLHDALQAMGGRDEHVAELVRLLT